MGLESSLIISKLTTSAVLRNESIYVLDREERTFHFVIKTMFTYELRSNINRSNAYHVGND